MLGSGVRGDRGEAGKRESLSALGKWQAATPPMWEDHSRRVFT